jgi:hypothetical protein
MHQSYFTSLGQNHLHNSLLVVSFGWNPRLRISNSVLAKL